MHHKSRVRKERERLLRVNKTDTEDVHKIEDLRGKREKFISGQELLARWPTIDRGRLLVIIEEGHNVASQMFPGMKKAGESEPYFLRIYDTLYHPVGIDDLMDSVFQEEVRTRKTGQKPHILQSCLFQIKQIENVERIFPELRKGNIKPTKKKWDDIRTKIRSIADNMWKKDKSLTIRDVIYSNEINEVTSPNTLSEKTLRNYVKDLAPNRNPGRRPATK